MSITFTCPEVRHTVAQVACDSPSMGLTCTASERCGYCEGGIMWESVTEVPEVNLANVTAAGILRLIGLGAEPGGEIPANEVSLVLRRVIRALNIEGSRAHLVEEAYESEDGRAHARAIWSGNTDEQTVRRLEDVRDLLVYAADHGYSVSWS